MKKKILIFTLNPQDTIRLHLDREVRAIDAALKVYRDQFVLERSLAVQLEDVYQEILDINPQIVHFTGHGVEDGGLIFEDERGYSKVVDGETLAGLFELFAESIECVVLNTAYSEANADRISQ